MATNPAWRGRTVGSLTADEVATILRQGHVSRGMDLYRYLHAQDALSRSQVAPSTARWCEQQIAADEDWVRELQSQPSEDAAEAYLYAQLQGEGAQSFCYVLMHLALYVAYAKHCQFQPGPDHSGVIDPSRAIPQDGRLSDTDIGSFQDLQRRLLAELGDVCRTSIGYDTMLQFLPQGWFGTDPPPRDWTELWQKLMATAEGLRKSEEEQSFNVEKIQAKMRPEDSGFSLDVLNNNLLYFLFGGFKHFKYVHPYLR